MDYKYFRDMYIRYLRHFLAKDEMTATTYDQFMALAYAVRSELVPHWINTQRNYIGKRRVYVLSMEHMLGKSLHRNMMNLGIEDAFTAAVSSLGISVKDLFEKDDELDLGNSAKARTVACMLESMVSLGLPSMAYGMRYDYGQFRQEIRNSMQIEFPNDWLHKGHPWEIVRSEYACVVKFFGQCKRIDDSSPLGAYEWTNAEEVYAMPYDTPLVGYKNEIVHTLRLWSAWACEEFLPDYMFHNDYVRACEEKSMSGRITKVLFPEEDVRRAHDMRLKQQYFFVSASIQDIVRRHKQNGNSISSLADKVAIHLCGSCCALAVPEMMRVLVDQEGIEWEKAWELTTSIFSYSSSATHRDHVEMWPVYKVEQLLPRIMQVIYDINLEHLDLVRSCAGHNVDLLRSLSLIEEGEVKRIRFADMAILGSCSVSGVSQSQTHCMKKNVFPAHSSHYSEKFSCKTSGVSHRHWLFSVNKPLSNFITRLIGSGWIKWPQELEKLEEYATSKVARKEFYEVKSMAKSRLAETLRERLALDVDGTMFFDMHTRSFHTTKRQVLHILYLLNNFLRIKEGGETLKQRRLHIFAGKASPSDFLAKQIIHLVNVIADLINSEPAVREQMHVIFIPNFGVSWAENLVGAADMSEQISTVTIEPSGTFGMKYAFNGAFTMVSRGGASLEMIRHLGDDNIFAFGKTHEEIASMNVYNPAKIIAEDDRLKKIFSFLDSHLQSIPEGHAIYPLLSSLKDSDRNFVLLDFEDYINKQEAADELYENRDVWDAKCLQNIARMGWFSSDRLVKDFAAGVWRII